MEEFEIFINRPVKVVVQANTYEEAIEIIKRQYGLSESEPLYFTRPIENIVDEEENNSVPQE